MKSFWTLEDQDGNYIGNYGSMEEVVEQMYEMLDEFNHDCEGSDRTLAVVIVKEDWSLSLVTEGNHETLATANV